MRVILVALLILVVMVAPYPQGHASSPASLSPHAQPSTNFNAPADLWQSIRPDLSPAALVTPDNILWVAWQSFRAGFFQIYYRTYNGISWSTIQIASTGGGFNASPTLARLNNGTIILIWSTGTNGNDNHLVYRTITNGLWTNQTQLTSGSSFADEVAKAVVTRDSTLWVFYERDTPTGPSTPPNRQVYYKTLIGNVWSADTPYTVDTSANTEPAPIVLKNGSLWTAWTRTPSTGGNSTIFYRTFNGTTWSGDITLSRLTTSDSQPNLLQDRNGTIWFFWTRPIALSTTVTQIGIFYKFSYNVANSWSSDIALSNWGSLNNPVDNLSPIAVQGFDTTIWVFFATNIVPLYDFDIYYMQSSSIYPVHSAIVSKIQVSGDTFYPLSGLRGIYPYGYNRLSQQIASFSVTVTDTGDFSENVILSIQAINRTNSIPMTQTQTGQVAPNLSTVFTFTWNVSGTFPGRYTIQATIAPLPGETQGNIIGNSYNILGSSFSRNSFIIFYAGDVNHDGVVNTGDFVVMGQAYQSVAGDPKFIPDGDLNRNGRIDTGDFVAAARNYQKRIGL